jgi:hypothetical protein
VAAVRSAMAIDAGEENWSAYSGALGRKFLRLEKYLAEPEAKANGKADASANGDKKEANH